MASPSRNTIYSDLGWSFYPAKIDSRDGKDPLTNLVDNTKYMVNEDLEINLNYEDRGSSPTATDYYVLAGDVNVLQDITLSIERVLGIMPQSTFGTISARLNDLASMTRFDTRLGGAGWTNIPTNYPGNVSPTILSHKHTGMPYSAPKIDLASESIGEVGKTRIQLDITDADTLTSADIPYIKTSTNSIKTILDSKFNSGGGTIAGNILVQGNIVSRLFGEFDCKDFSEVTGSTNIADNNAYSGTTRSFAKTAIFFATGYSTAFPVRFGKYSVTLRAKCSEITSSANVLRIVVWETNSVGGKTTIIDKYIKADKFLAANVYQQFYYTVSHDYSGSSNKNLNVTIWYHGVGISNVSIDSITVMPVHTAVWDE